MENNFFYSDHNLTPEEKWEKAGLENNFIFYKIMRSNPELCRELIEILLQKKIDRIEMAAEETIEIDWDSHGIRLDVYARNETQAFNLEMQVINTKELPKRARYYQGVIDVDTLKSGQRYRELKESYIIFICIDDIFHKGLPVYKFENICQQNKSLRLDDKAYKYFFSAANCAKLLDEKQKAFFNFLLHNSKPADTFTRNLEKQVLSAKTKLIWRQQFMNWERQRTYDYDDGKEAGIAIGIAEGRKSGIEEGRKSGIEEGRKSGIEEGRKSGIEEGRKSGIEEGRKSGIEEGRKSGIEEGISEGKAQAKLEAAIQAVRLLGITPEKAAETFGADYNQLILALKQ